MQIHPDATVDGWCWAPARPRARLAFEILADDRVLAAGEAALPRPDLQVPGMDDTRHGFRLALPPGSIDRFAPSLISARSGGVVFGRRLLDPADAPAGDPATLALHGALGMLSERLAACAAPSVSTPAARLRAAARELAASLPAAAAQMEPSVDATRRLLAASGPRVHLARPAAPCASFILRASATAPATLQRLRALAPATHALAAETLLLDCGSDARTALLASVAPGLLLTRAPAGGGNLLWHLAQAARGEWLLLLDESAPSPAALEWLLARLRATAIPLALSARLADPARAPMPVAAPTGVAVAVRRSLIAEGDDPASLRRRIGGGVALAEPWPAA